MDLCISDKLGSGEIALAIEKANSEDAKLKITEVIALLQYIGSKYKLDLHTNMRIIYNKKIHRLTRLGHE
jgi:hypothetical protein